MLRWSVAAASLALLATGCTAPPQTPAPTSPPVSVSPSATRLSPVPRATDTPTPAAFRYLATDLEIALPNSFAGHKLQKSLYLYPGAPNETVRRDPLAAHPQVSPELCRDVIRTQGVPGIPGDFIAPTTPSARAFTPLPATTANSRPFVNAVVVELSPALGDRLLDQRLPPPPECAHIQVDGKLQASVTERPLPNFGVRARYIVRTYPLEGAQWTERTIQYRTNTYVGLIRLDAHTNPEAPFLTFAQAVRDKLKASLR
ncbi:hypothetical protein AB0E69_14095 [Kribbella sp. NPDC026611]|uniref:hypothetical protein n=1 Tax=Kribbella sp. NPDC026611 TaxID=3154911 RepID=UPI003400EFFD